MRGNVSRGDDRGAGDVAVISLVVHVTSTAGGRGT
jgi:hypothetical protein